MIVRDYTCMIPWTSIRSTGKLAVWCHETKLLTCFFLLPSYPKYEQNSTNQQWAQKFEQDCSSPMPPQYARHSGPPRGSPDTLRQTPRRRRGTQEPRQANTQGSAPKRPLQTARRGGLSEQGGTRGRTQGSSAQPATTSGKSKKKASDVGGPTLIPGPDVAASPQDSKKAAAKADFSIKKPKKKTCSNCQVPGHDSRNCPLNKYGLGINQEKIKEELRKQEELKKQEESRKQELKRKEIEQEQASKAKAQAAKDASIKKAAKKKCSQCSVSGHDARNCPLNQYGLGKKAKDLSHEYHQETTTTTTTTTKTSASSKSTRGKVMSGRVERTAVKKKPTTKKK